MSGTRLPKVTDVSNVDMRSPGLSSCLIDMFVRNEFSYPRRYIMAPKVGVITNGGGWYCYYGEDIRSNEIEPTAKSGQKFGKKVSKTANQYPPEHAELFFDGEAEDEFTNSDFDGLSDCSSAISTASQVEKAQYSEDEPPDDLNFWLSTQNEQPSDVSEATASGGISSRQKKDPLLVDQRAEINSLIAPVVDTRRYALSINPITSIVTVVWKLSERSDHWDAFCDAKNKVLSLGRNALHASCNSSLSVRTYEECLLRAQRWCCWHSTWVYSERPSTRLLGFIRDMRFSL